MNRDEGLFAAVRANMPGEERVVLQQIDGTGLTFDDLVARSAQFAGALASSGIKPGYRVAVQVEKSVEALVLYLACLRCGAVYVPLNPAYTWHELAYFISDAEPALLVATPEKERGVADLAPDVKTLTLTGDGRAGSLPAQV